MPTNMTERVLGAEALLGLVAKLAVELGQDEGALLESIGRLGTPYGWRNPEEVVLALRWAYGRVDASALVRRTADPPVIGVGRQCVN